MKKPLCDDDDDSDGNGVDGDDDCHDGDIRHSRVHSVHSEKEWRRKILSMMT